MSRYVVSIKTYQIAQVPKCDYLADTYDVMIEWVLIRYLAYMQIQITSIEIIYNNA